MPQVKLQYRAECAAQFDLDTELLTRLAALGRSVQLSIDDSSGTAWEVFLDYPWEVSPEKWDTENILSTPRYHVACQFADAFSRQLQARFPGLVVTVKKPPPPQNPGIVNLEWLHVDW